MICVNCKLGSNKTSCRYKIDIRALQMNQYIEQNTG